MYTWRKEWVNKYESLWSVLEKFKYANSASNKDIYEIFSVRDKNGHIMKRQYKRNQSYLTMEGIDGYFLEKILGINLKQRNLEHIKNITYIISSDTNINYKDSISNNLRLCPKCIKNGYHSVWHQINFLDKCFIHEDTKLITKCPKCMCVFDYSFNNKSNKLGFKCSKCDYIFLESENLIDLFQKWNMENIILNNEIKKWLDLNHKYENQNRKNMLLCYTQMNVKNYYTFYKKIFGSDVLYEIFQFMGKDIKNNNKSIKMILQYTIRCNSKNKSIIKDLEMQVYKSYITILKAIARRIRKNNKQISKNIKILKRSKFSFYHINSDGKYNWIWDRSLNRPPIDLSTYSYLMWRRDLEGLQLYTDVHTKSKYSKYTYNKEQSYINTQQVEIFNYLIVKLVRNLPVEKRTSDYKCIIERIIGSYMVEHYRNWQYFAERLDTNKIDMSETIPYIMPFVLVAKPDRCKNQMEVYIIKHVNDNNWIKNVDYNYILKI